ncbi:cupredoxin domain-containing protein [Piscinibacter koreensis]|uniref:Cupredoxin family protein n=1 Tax=Piscinibacter koreensis TaxID=2742824 RepID=A0A7Y6NSF5_9BURK|nr:cupredoxin family protein [Schlegelella koreensis]NUZ08491.1 cupredoxin family protein [Schlegelella koreensis]
MKTNYLAIAAVLAMASTLSLASGNHAGGHGDAGGHGHGGSGESAIGAPGVAGKVTRTVKVDMTDAMRFIPASIDVKQGETIRFQVKNSGKAKHEFVLGTEAELREHYQVMLKNPEMEHEEPNMITLAGGKSGEVVWQFTKAGKVHFGCLQPGHYDAGMKGAVTVAGAQGNAKSDGHGHKH